MQAQRTGRAMKGGYQTMTHVTVRTPSVAASISNCDVRADLDRAKTDSSRYDTTWLNAPRLVLQRSLLPLGGELPGELPLEVLQRPHSRLLLIHPCQSSPGRVRRRGSLFR
jgi:hypothetical protein